MTPALKSAIPALSLMGVLVLIVSSFYHPRGDGGPVHLFCCIGACAIGMWSVWWSLPFKNLMIDGDRFIIGGYRLEYVKISHLKEIKEWRSGRSGLLSYITLVFDPPTAYGRKIKFWPPMDPFNKEFDRVSSSLRDIVDKNAKSPDATPTTGALHP
jgi:hypothetical protein